MTPIDELNRPDVHAAVTEAFHRYEAALLAHDVATLNDFFLDSEATTRFGVAEHAHGIESVRAYRKRAQPLPPGRQLQHTIVTTIGANAASVSTEFTYPDCDMTGRQTQTWVRTDQGWKILCAHVSETSAGDLRRD